jgi:hypothetical protein
MQNLVDCENIADSRKKVDSFWLVLYTKLKVFEKWTYSPQGVP